MAQEILCNSISTNICAVAFLLSEKSKEHACTAKSLISKVIALSLSIHADSNIVWVKYTYLQ